MAYDFAKRKKRRKTPTKKEVSKRPVWFFTGLIAGLFIAFLLQLYGFGVSKKPTLIAIDTPIVTQEEIAEEPSPKSNRPRFEFYDVLPESELKIRETKQPTTTQNNKKSRKITKKSYQYLLQAGSFSKIEDADRRKAEVLLLGTSASISKVMDNNGDPRFRVIVGPFNERIKMAKTRNQLHSANIETLLMQKELN